MRRITDMDNIQIEITNACHLSCSNCTRFCPHIRKPFMMDFDTFKRAVDSMKDYPKMTGIMGGEPLLHPDFEKFCDYALSVIPREKLGLWSSFPDKYEHYRDVIVRTFGQIFVNDHSRSDIQHAPILVGAEECIEDEQEMWYLIDKCWLQAGWSASINPKGAFFCEVAAAMAMLFDEDSSWPVTDTWWLKVPFQFKEQMEHYCRRCGMALTLGRRSSKDGIDDISPLNVKRLKDCSRRVIKGDYRVHDCKLVDTVSQMFQYKEEWFRDKVAAKYGIYLTATDKGFLEPHLMHQWDKNAKSIWQQYSDKYGA
jgi:hypothetical protein